MSRRRSAIEPAPQPQPATEAEVQALLDLYQTDRAKAIQAIVQRLEMDNGPLPPVAQSIVTNVLTKGIDGVLNGGPIQDPARDELFAMFITAVIGAIIDELPPALGERLRPLQETLPRALAGKLTAALERMRTEGPHSPRDAIVAAEEVVAGWGLPPPPDNAEGRLRVIADLLSTIGVAIPDGVDIPALVEAAKYLIGGAPTEAPLTRRAARPAPLPEHLRLTADRIQQGVFEALCRISEWQEGVTILDQADRDASFAHAYVVDHPGFRLVVGYPRPSQDWLDALADDEVNTIALRQQVVLTERFMEQTGGDPFGWARLRDGDFYRDLLRPNKRGFRKEQKGRVADALDALAGLHVYPEWTVNGEQLGLRAGELWDIVHAIRKSPQRGTSSYLSFRPGAWWSDRSWRESNPYLGHVSRGLVELDLRNKWATRLALDYALLQRRRAHDPAFRNRQEVLERVRYILQRTGFDRSYSGRMSRQQREFEDANDALVEVGLLAEHAYGDRPAPDWRNRKKLLRFPRRIARLPTQLRLPLP